MDVKGVGDKTFAKWQPFIANVLSSRPGSRSYLCRNMRFRCLMQVLRVQAGAVLRKHAHRRGNGVYG